MNLPLLVDAQKDLTAAFVDAAGRMPAAGIAGGVLAGTWLPGLYKDPGGQHLVLYRRNRNGKHNAPILSGHSS